MVGFLSAENVFERIKKHFDVNSLGRIKMKINEKVFDYLTAIILIADKENTEGAHAIRTLAIDCHNMLSKATETENEEDKK